METPNQGIEGPTLRQYLGAKPCYEDRLLRGWSQVSVRTIDSALLSDEQTLLLRQRIEEKLKSGTGVLKAPEEPEAAEAASNVIDLMQVLKESLQGRRPQVPIHQTPSKPERSPKKGKPRSR